MISNPELQAVPSSAAPRWPRHFSHWQLMSLVPGVVHRLATAARVLELEVGAPALLTILARIYPSSQFIGLTSCERARQGLGPVEMTARNLHFRTVEEMDLSRFRQVDLILALGGVLDQGLLSEAALSTAPGGFLVLRERDRTQSGLRLEPGTRLMPGPRAERANLEPVQHLCVVRTLTRLFASVHTVSLPEDPGYVYYVARSA